MTAKLHLSVDLALPPDAITQTIGILARKGAGKTYTGNVLAEEFARVLAKFCVLDPLGVWYGLRASATGESRGGLPVVIFGGDHADIPLDEKMGASLADFVSDSDVSCVLDLSLLRKGEQARFVTDFAERLYHHNRQPVHLFLDEADLFAPQRPLPGEQRMLGALEDIVRRGRARGIGVTMITQRAAVLNKDVLTQIELLICMQMTGPQDKKAVDAWVQYHGDQDKRDQMMRDLPELPVGTAWVWSPSWLRVFKKVKIRRRDTFDSSATPKAGQKTAAPKTLVSINLDELRARFASVVEQQKADDPVELKRQLAALNKQLAHAQSSAPAPIIQRVEVPVFAPADLARFESAIASVRSQGQQLLDAANRLEAALKAQRPSQLPVIPVATLARPPAQSRADGVSIGYEVIPNGARRMLQCLAQRHPLKLTRAQLGTLAGFTPSGGTFGNYFGMLKRFSFLIESSNGDVEITSSGLNYVGSDVPPAPATTAETLTLWRERLPAGAARMLDILADLYPRSITRQDLGEQSGFTASGGTFGNYLGTLRRNGLVEVNGESVSASRTLFIG